MPIPSDVVPARKVAMDEPVDWAKRREGLEHRYRDASTVLTADIEDGVVRKIHSHLIEKQP